MMTKQEAIRLAEPIVRKVVDCIAERRYSEITEIAESECLSSADLEELVEGFLNINGLSHMDKYDVVCNFHPQYDYHQFEAYVYHNGSGFAVDYDLTTNHNLNDLTLQMEFLFTDSGTLIAKIIDLHIL